MRSHAVKRRKPSDERETLATHRKRPHRENRDELVRWQSMLLVDIEHRRQRQETQRSHELAEATLRPSLPTDAIHHPSPAPQSLLEYEYWDTALASGNAFSQLAALRSMEHSAKEAKGGMAAGLSTRTMQESTRVHALRSCSLSVHTAVRWCRGQ